MGYREDYEKAATVLEKLLDESEQLEEKILDARKRLNALETLMGFEVFREYQKKGFNYLRVENLSQARLADQVRRLMKTGRTFTTREIRAELEQVGVRIAAHTNPLATIDAVLGSLTESGELIQAKKHGRKAWHQA